MRLWFQETAVFLVFGFVSAQLQGFQTCVFAKASPKTKNPRCPSLHIFCQCSKMAAMRDWRERLTGFQVPGRVTTRRTGIAQTCIAVAARQKNIAAWVDPHSSKVNTPAIISNYFVRNNFHSTAEDTFATFWRCMLTQARFPRC